MPIQFNCAHCNRAIKTPDETAGKKCRCPDCGEIMPIPAETSSEFDFPGIDSPLPLKPDAQSNPYASFSNPTAQSSPVPQNYALPDRSPIILTFGIISILSGFISCGCCLTLPLGLGFGIPAWLMGNTDLKQIKRGRRNPDQKSITQAGMVCGIIGVSISGISLILNVAMTIFQLAAFSM